MRNFSSLAFMATLFWAISCGKETATGPNLPELLNFFPIAEGNKWIYSCWTQSSGHSLPTVIYNGSEIVEIIKHDSIHDANSFYQERFQISIISDGQTTTESANGDSVVNIIEPSKSDTLEMALQDSFLVYLSTKEDKSFCFPRFASQLKVVLPDTGHFIRLEYHPPHDSERSASYTLIKQVGFQRIQTTVWGPVGVWYGSIYLNDFIQASTKSEH
ncbi:hypothetical protein JW998_01630 [candidate division KSB1 bacterium]|nr:hypothetical protein [candidate division KSB1 bacterium]